MFNENIMKLNNWPRKSASVLHIWIKIPVGRVRFTPDPMDPAQTPI